MASIRNLGGCPCPRCLIPLGQLHKMGTPKDMQDRETKARVDNDFQRSNIDIARKIIYEQNYAITNTNTEHILKPKSLVPTLACLLFRQSHLIRKLTLRPPERFLY